MKVIALMFLLLASVDHQQQVALTGAWEWKNGSEVYSVIFSDKCYTVTEYNVVDKKFGSTYGGSWKILNNKLVLLEEFNAANAGSIGKERLQRVSFEKGTMVTSFSDSKPVTWKRIDNGTPGQLAGAWLITARQNNGSLSKIVPGARRTMKILSGTRFQWIAYNTESKEFFGTGGGTYTTEGGKYTENIEFFSRDNSRVGAKLQFDFSIEDGNWHHKGLSSKGEPIDEVWTKREVIGL